MKTNNLFIFCNVHIKGPETRRVVCIKQQYNVHVIRGYVW